MKIAKLVTSTLFVALGLSVVASSAFAQNVRHTPQKMRGLVEATFRAYEEGYCTDQRRMSLRECRQSTELVPFAAGGKVSFVYQWWPMLDDTYPESWGEKHSIWIETSEPLRYGVIDSREQKWMYRLERLYPKKSIIGGELFMRMPHRSAVYKYQMMPGNRLGPELLVMDHNYNWIRHNNIGLNDLVKKLENASAGYR